MPREYISSEMMNRVLAVAEQIDGVMVESKIRVSFEEDIDPDNLWLEVSISYIRDENNFNVCLMVGDGTLDNERVVHLTDLNRSDIFNTVNSWLETEFGLMYFDASKTVSNIEVVEYEVIR